MRTRNVLVSVFLCIVCGFVCTTMVSAGNENILDTGMTGEELVLSDMALRDTVSYAGEPSDWNIYFYPGIRFGTDDRVIGFYDLVVPVYLSDTSMLFVNPRFSHDSTGGHEWNLGGGYRQILWDNQLMLGINAYYDLKKDGKTGYWFDQWGMGFEAMGEFDNVLAAGGGLGLTGRFNFYIPLSGSKSEGGVGVGGGGYTLKTLGIYSLGGGGVMYEPLTGLDYEAGIRIPYLSEYVETWLFAGGYHYWASESGSMDGFYGRIEVIPTDFLSLDFEYRTDNWYGDEFYGEVRVEVPFSIGNLVKGENPFEGLGSRFGGSRDLNARMVEPVRRDIDIKIKEVTSGDGVTIAGGLIEEVIYVSEGAELDAARDGTYEHPWATLAEAMADPRFGVTAFTIHIINDNLGDGVVPGGTIATDNVLLWGCGVGHPTYGCVSGMTGGYPTINSTVTLNANNLKTCGLLLDTPASIGIQVNGGVGILIRCNIFDDPLMNYAIRIMGGSDVTVTGNTILNASRGIWIDPGAGGTGYLISSNRFNLTDTGIGIFNGTGITITGNTFTISGTRFDGIVGGGVTTVADPIRITNNTINATATGPGLCWGININDWGASTNIYAVITGNRVTFTSSGGSVTGIGMNGGSGVDLGSAALPIVISGNVVDVDVTGGGAGAEGRGIVLVGPDELYADGTGIRGNTIDVDSSETGLVAGIYTQMDDDTYVNINNNTMTGLTGGGNVFGIRSFTTFGHPDTGTYGVSGNPNTISGNRIGLTAGNEGTGIYVGGEGNVFTTINGNPQINVTATSNAMGIRVYTNGMIGNTGSVPCYLQNNSGTLSSPVGRYMLRLWTGVADTGNFVNWSGNSFTPTGGDSTWDGNYTAGETLPQAGGDQDQPVEMNFDNTGAGDVITP